MNKSSENERRQTAIMDTKQLIAYIKPISHHTYWKIIAKDPRFPKPIMGGNGAKALHGVEAVDLYLQEAARTGFILPDVPATQDQGSQGLAVLPRQPRRVPSRN